MDASAGVDLSRVTITIDSAAARSAYKLEMYPEIESIYLHVARMPSLGKDAHVSYRGDVTIKCGWCVGTWFLYLGEDMGLYWPENTRIGWCELHTTSHKTTQEGEPSMAAKSRRPNVTRDGDAISITGMSVKDAVAALVRMEEQDNQEVNIHCEFTGMFLTEGLIAFSEALVERYGRSFGETVQGFFGPVCPTLLSVAVGPGEIRQMVWGKISVPGIAGTFQTSISQSNGSPIFALGGKIKQKHKGEVEELFELTRQIGKERSIYKGKALELRFPDPEETSNPLDYAPKFMEFGEVEPPVFNADIQQVIDNYIYEDIEATGMTKQNGMPIKKGILLEGPPGVGKTLLAHTLAQKCQLHGWTFCYLRDVKDLAGAVELVRGRWEPTMIFAEDIDRVVGKDRTDAVNDVLNIIDGVDAKLSDIVVLVTTNEIEVIHKAMLRPGRLDVLISVTAPDATTVEALIRREAGPGLAVDADLTAVGLELEGTMPAVIVQVVQRAKRAAQRRVRLSMEGKVGATVIHPPVMAVDLLIAARSMKAHIDRLKPMAQDERTPIEKAAAVLAGALEKQAEADGRLAEVGWQYMTPPPQQLAVVKGNGSGSRVAGKAGPTTETE